MRASTLKQLLRSRQIVPLLAAAGLSLVVSVVAYGATVTPAIIPLHNATYRKLSISNRAQLLGQHPRAQVSYQWQELENGSWVSVAGADRSSFTLTLASAQNTVRVVVTFTRRRTEEVLASNASVPAPPPTADPRAPTVRASTLPSPYVPASWLGPNPQANCAGAPDDKATNQTDSVLINLDYCGATLEGLAPLMLPANWAHLSDTHRAFALLNLERIARGETPFFGLSTTLDSYALQGAVANTDPRPPLSANWHGSNWFGGTSTKAVPTYVFDDGPGSRNLACAEKGTPGCWGHRDNILENARETHIDIGLADGPNGDSTEIFGFGYTLLNFTWSAELSAGYPQGLPASSGLTPATITGVTRRRNGSIAVTGVNLDTVTGVWFANVKDSSRWSCWTPDKCTIAVRKRLKINTAYSLYLLNPAGLSALTPAGTYTTGL